LGTRREIVDERSRPVPRGEVGRIFVGNELLFEGYSNGTSKEQRHGLMATGDRGYLDGGDRLMVVCREDDLVISGAEKIYPLEVEEAILTLPGVREVAVVGRPDEELGQRLVAYVGCVRPRPCGTGPRSMTPARPSIREREPRVRRSERARG
jgi:fatty-acyl-CoA synthase